MTDILGTGTWGITMWPQISECFRFIEKKNKENGNIWQKRWFLSSHYSLSGQPPVNVLENTSCCFIVFMTVCKLEKSGASRSTVIQQTLKKNVPSHRIWLLFWDSAQAMYSSENKFTICPRRGKEQILSFVWLKSLTSHAPCSLSFPTPSFSEFIII